MSRRIGIFVHYSANNSLAPYVLPYLQGLKEVCSEIVFVSNSLLAAPDRQKIEPLVAKVLQRDNSAMDFGAWKHAIDAIGWPYLETFDELVLANDSCYAPMFPLADMFKVMRTDDSQFWGVTEHPAGITRSGELAAHLQSYFLVFNKSVILSGVFRRFWSEVSLKNTDYNAVIGNYEARLTPLLNNAGFTHGVYIDHPDHTSDASASWEDSLYINPTIWSWRELLQRKSPFLKRKAITFHLDRVSRLIRSGYGGKVTKSAFIHTFFWKKSIERSSTRYPVEIIFDEIRAQYGDRWVDSSHLGKRLLFRVCAPWRFYRKTKRLMQAKLSASSHNP